MSSHAKNHCPQQVKKPAATPNLNLPPKPPVSLNSQHLATLPLCAGFKNRNPRRRQVPQQKRQQYWLQFKQRQQAQQPLQAQQPQTKQGLRTPAIGVFQARPHSMASYPRGGAQEWMAARDSKPAYGFTPPKEAQEPKPAYGYTPKAGPDALSNGVGFFVPSGIISSSAQPEQLVPYTGPSQQQYNGTQHIASSEVAYIAQEGQAKIDQVHVTYSSWSDQKKDSLAPIYYWPPPSTGTQVPIGGHKATTTTASANWTPEWHAINHVASEKSKGPRPSSSAASPLVRDVPDLTAPKKTLAARIAERKKEEEETARAAAHWWRQRQIDLAVEFDSYDDLMFIPDLCQSETPLYYQPFYY